MRVAGLVGGDEVRQYRAESGVREAVDIFVGARNDLLRAGGVADVGGFAVVVPFWWERSVGGVKRNMQRM
jgi:hypothetical protein